MIANLTEETSPGYKRQVIEHALFIGAAAAAVVAVMLGLAALLEVPISVGMAIRLVIVFGLVVALSIYAFTYIPTAAELALWRTAKYQRLEVPQLPNRPVAGHQAMPTAILCAQQINSLQLGGSRKAA